ncbi:hypothetical protein FGB62_5g017 [Gracilaria domingensis]|nr:hypothetical protein FGB62_5g017 [Gracilaria domingensis]
MLQIPLPVGVFNSVKYAFEELIIIFILQKAVRGISGLWIKNRLHKRNYVLGGTPILDDLALQPNLGRKGRSRYVILAIVIALVHGSALFLELGTDSVQGLQFSGVGPVRGRTSVIDHNDRAHPISVAMMQVRGSESVAGCVERLENKTIFRAAEVNGRRCSEEFSSISLYVSAGMPDDCQLIGKGKCVLRGMRMQVQKVSFLTSSSEVYLSLVFGNITTVSARVFAYYGESEASIDLDGDDEEDLGIREFLCIYSVFGIEFLAHRAICISKTVDVYNRGLYLKVSRDDFAEVESFSVGEWYQSDSYGAAIFSSDNDGEWIVGPDLILLAYEIIGDSNNIDTPIDMTNLAELISISSVGDFGKGDIIRTTRLVEAVVRPVIRVDALLVYFLFVLVAAATAIGSSCYAKDENSRLNNPLVYISVVSKGTATLRSGSHSGDDVRGVREIARNSIARDSGNHLAPV